nr:nuclease-related domain-containing protein [Pseudomonas syringae]
MARMIPDNGPRGTESKGERDLYTILKAELPYDYVVIHSLPWLSSAVTKVDPQAKPTGEIDFLIIHPDKGLLVLEVKSGEYGVKNNRFVHLHKQFSIDPIGQTRNNVHGIAKWLGSDPLLRLRIGYGFVFPDSDFAGIGVCMSFSESRHVRLYSFEEAGFTHTRTSGNHHALRLDFRWHLIDCSDRSSYRSYLRVVHPAIFINISDPLTISE